MEIWVPITLSAALFQALRTAMQQKMRARVSVNAAGFVRFAYGLPVAAAVLVAAMLASGQALPHPAPRFYALCALGGLFQIFATNLLIMAFGFRNFAVGTAFAKTEAMQAALLAWPILGERPPPFVWLGIAIGLVGVMMLSLVGRNLRARDLLAGAVQPAALCGLGAGFAFSLTAISIKAASHAIPVGDGGVGPYLVRAFFMLSVTTLLQTAMQGGYMAWRRPQELRAAFREWRAASLVGAASAAGSACWFLAFTLAAVALVRAVGQVEVVFTLVLSRFYLRETLHKADLAGLVLVVTGVFIVVVGA
ncbi:MAG: EamA family transporter [Rhodospirillales bacterium]|nr:EamA family transporter [Rhodospirillales bacterium]